MINLSIRSDIQRDPIFDPFSIKITNFDWSIENLRSESTYKIIFSSKITLSTMKLIRRWLWFLDHSIFLNSNVSIQRFKWPLEKSIHLSSKYLTSDWLNNKPMIIDEWNIKMRILDQLWPSQRQEKSKEIWDCTNPSITPISIPVMYLLWLTLLSHTYDSSILMHLNAC